MIDHVSIGVSDIARTKTFYDTVLKPLGYSCLNEYEGSLGYGKDQAQFWANVAKKPVEPNVESGLHFCFTAPSRNAVDAFHAGGIDVGAISNGAPGLRPDYGDNYYAAYLIDPDGYRIEAYCAGR